MTQILRNKGKHGLVDELTDLYFKNIYIYIYVSNVKAYCVFLSHVQQDDGFT